MSSPSTSTRPMSAVPKRPSPASGKRRPGPTAPIGQAAATRERRVARAVDGHRGGPRTPEGVPPDARRGHRRAGGTPDPDRRPLARGLRLLQLPGPRPRPGGHRGGPRVPREVGDPPVLVAAARQPRPVRTARGDHHGAARVRGLAAPADDHPHPHVRDPRPGRQRRDVPRRQGAQDGLRRRERRPRARGDDPALPPQRRRAPRAGRQGVEDDPARDRGRRGELDDRERPRHQGVRAHRPRARRAPVHRRRPRVRRDRRALPRRALRVGPARQRRRPPSRGDLRRRRPGRGVQQGVQLAAVLPRAADAAEGRAQGRCPPYLYSGPRRSPRSRRRSPASR